MSDQFGMPMVDCRPTHEVITELRQQMALLLDALNMWLVSPQGERNLAMHETECVKSTLKALAAKESKQ